MIQKDFCRQLDFRQTRVRGIFFVHVCEQDLFIYLVEQEVNERSWHTDNKDTFSVSLQT